MFVIPAGPYFQAIGLTKDELVQMLGLLLHRIDGRARRRCCGAHGALHVGNAAGSMLAVVPALLAMAIGQRIRSLASEETFRRLLFLGLLLLGAQQVFRYAF